MTDDRFEFVTEMSIRYRDLDPWDHVNNAVYATYLEQARIQYLDAVLDESMGGRDFVLAHLELDYQQSVEYRDELTIALRVSEMGTSSLSFAYEVRADGEVAATGETTQVHIGADGPAPLPDSWRETIEQFEPALA
ncbi:acyl-CoA thioesterase [Halorientalis salina]|uniref:acyl-CoA thioesterase n=1 Tax=Halorientalis salina TaxID=2932266 RepID=UPI0010ACEA00|nr:thioesterase family protein [Halorientalis salina]